MKVVTLYLTGQGLPKSHGTVKMQSMFTLIETSESKSRFCFIYSHENYDTIYKRSRSRFFPFISDGKHFHDHYMHIHVDITLMGH